MRPAMGIFVQMSPVPLQRWLAVAASGVLLAAPAAVAVMAPAATAAVSAPNAAQASTPADQFLGVSCRTNRSCVAVGWYIPADGIKRPLAGRWDGASWHLGFPRVPRGAAASELRAVSCASPSDCLAIGDTGAGGAGSGRLFAERWNGSTWRMVPIADPGRAVIPAMSCPSAKSCFAAGYRSSNKAITERWTGRSWSLVTARRPRPNSQLLGIACPGPGNCYAAGWSSGTSSTARQHALIEHWDGRRWSTRPTPGTPLGTSLNSVSCPAAARCTAVGSSNAAGGAIRMQVNDLKAGRWTARQLSGKALDHGDPGLISVSCAAPHDCSAALTVMNISGDFSDWGFASRGAIGGWHFQKAASHFPSDTPSDISCAPGGVCMLVGGKGDNEGRGGIDDVGSTLAWRGSGTSFAPVTTPPPPATVGGR